MKPREVFAIRENKIIFDETEFRILGGITSDSMKGDFDAREDDDFESQSANYLSSPIGKVKMALADRSVGEDD